MSQHLQPHLSKLETDPIRNFKFLVDISHAGSSTKIGFTSVSGLSVSTDSIAYRTGGMNTAPQQIPGQSSFTPVTFQRGVLIGSNQHWNWMRELFDVKVGEGLGRFSTKGKTTFRTDVDIYVMEHPVTQFQANVKGGMEVASPIKIRLYNAWPTAISYSDLNAGDNALFMEQMTLVHEGFAIHWGGSDVESEAADF